MRLLEEHSLWIGGRGDLRDMRRIRLAGIASVIDLAVNEEPISIARETVLCRFPLVDGPGNAPWLLRSAAMTVAELLRGRVPTLVMCGAGMSRAPSIAAAAIVLRTGRDPQQCLIEVTRDAPADVSPSLWNDVVGAIQFGSLGDARSSEAGPLCEPNMTTRYNPDSTRLRPSRGGIVE